MDGIIQLKPNPSRLSGNELLKSPAYMLIANPHCLPLLVQSVLSALAFALARAGSNRPARMAMIAITTSSSMRVKPCDWRTEWRVNGGCQTRDDRGGDAGLQVRLQFRLSGPCFITPSI